MIAIKYISQILFGRSQPPPAQRRGGGVQTMQR